MVIRLVVNKFLYYDKLIRNDMMIIEIFYEDFMLW